MYFDFTQCKQKGFAPILIILGIVLLLAVAGGAYYSGKLPANFLPKAPEQSNISQTIENNETLEEDKEFLLKSPFLSSFTAIDLSEPKAEMVIITDAVYGPPNDENLYQLQIEDSGNQSKYLFAKSRQVDLGLYIDKPVMAKYRKVEGVILGEQQLVLVDSIREQIDEKGEEFFVINGKKYTVKRVGGGEYCEGRLPAKPGDYYSECDTGLKCQFNSGTAQDAPGKCVPNKGDVEGDFCGGFAGKLCSEGFTCKLEGDYPDAGGKCVNE